MNFLFSNESFIFIEQIRQINSVSEVSRTPDELFDFVVTLQINSNDTFTDLRHETPFLLKFQEMGKNLEKKVINSNKIPHPKGRKVAQLFKKTIKSNARERKKFLHQMKLNLLGEKLLWFKENLEPIDKYTPELTTNLIERYLGRFDEELKQIQLKHSTGNRKSRQHASREDIIKMTIESEKNQFLTSGIEVPDLLNSKQLNLLRNWSGELRYLQNFTVVRYTKSKLENMKYYVKDSAKGKGEKVLKVSKSDATLKGIEEEKQSMLMDLDP